MKQRRLLAESLESGRTTPIPCHAGFSLLEILCAVVVLGIGLVGLTEGITASLKSSKDAERYTMAVFLARGQLETLRADGLLAVGVESGDFGSSFPRYNWRQSVRHAGVDGLHEVVVQISFGEREEPLYELSSLLFEVPPEPWEQSQTIEQRRQERRRQNER